MAVELSNTAQGRDNQGTWGKVQFIEREERRLRNEESKELSAMKEI